MSGVHDEALELFEGCGAEFAGGLANHGPMAADALVAMGRPAAVVPWAERYRTRLDDEESPRWPIVASEWREALGDPARMADWVAFFEREIAAEAWPNVLRMWVPRLAPGFLASGTHGMLRTAHAVRALEADDSALRRGELARGLALWAARYASLPAVPYSGPAFEVVEAVERVPIVPKAERQARGFLTDTVLQLADRPEFGPAIGLLSLEGPIGPQISRFTRVFAQVYLENARTPIPFVHSVTAPSAIRMLEPHIGEAASRDLLRYAWQAAAGFLAVYSNPDASAVVPEPALLGDLPDRAIASGDEHAIKFTEACLREYAISGDEVFVLAATDVGDRLRATG